MKVHSWLPVPMTSALGLAVTLAAEQQEGGQQEPDDDGLQQDDILLEIDRLLNDCSIDFGCEM